MVEAENILERLKFERIGCDPLDVDDAQNLIEQINQQATYEAGVDALEILMNRHPGLTWNFAPGSISIGHDIHSDDDSVIAEVFAAVSLSSNSKFGNDLARLFGSESLHRYLIFRSPSKPPDEYQVMGITVVSLGSRNLSNPKARL